MDYQTRKLVSVKASRRDGRSSCERLLALRLLDIVEISVGTMNADIDIMHVLRSLKEDFTHRIGHGRQPQLDSGICKRLCKALLKISSQRVFDFKRFDRRPTEAANLALDLFTGFFRDVETFLPVVETFSAGALKAALLVEERTEDYVEDDVRELALEAVRLIITKSPKFQDWHVLVDSDVHDKLESRLGDLVLEEEDSPKVQSSVDAARAALPDQGDSYYDMEAHQVANVFKTNLEKGLSGDAIASRVAQYGKNVIPPPPKKTIWKMLWEQMTDFMMVILTLAALISAAIGDYKAAVVLIVVVILNASIGLSQELKAEAALANLASLTSDEAIVIRGGQQKNLAASELVPGDIVILDEGAGVPADLRMVECSNLSASEAMLTGESEPVKKKPAPIKGENRKVALGDRLNMCYSGTLILGGSGRGVVVRTGLSTEMGRISGSLVEAGNDQQLTVLQKQLQGLGKVLVVAAVVLCLIFVMIGLLRGFSSELMIKSGVSLAVSVVPEGLVAVTTIAFSIGVSNMAKKNAIVRTLAKVEALGAVSTICSDKTGTLTEGKMRVTKLYSDSSLMTVTGAGIVPEGDCVIADFDAEQDDLSPHGVRATSLDDMPKPFLLPMIVSSVCNNSAINYNEEEKCWEPSGDPTEVALEVMARKVGAGREDLTNAGLLRLREVPFDSDRKLMSMIVAAPATSKIAGPMTAAINGGSPVAEGSVDAVVLAKGGLEAILIRSTSCLRKSTDGTTVTKEPLSEEFMTKTKEHAEALACTGLRVLALAARNLAPAETAVLKDGETMGDVEEKLVFVGLVGMYDPPRPAAKTAVAECHAAGIRVCCCTGDHVSTATSIAKTLGIIGEDEDTRGLVLSGHDLDLLTPEALASLHPFPRVFARVSPDHKIQVVRALQLRPEEVVAMTGDGVNDAPAIKAADIGIAMGIAGTNVTKDAADLILADDRYGTIAAAVREGRRIYANVGKFLVYLLSCSLAEIVVMLVSVSAGYDPPFRTLPILYANLVADVPPSLALSVDPEEPGIMTQSPRDPQAPIFDKYSRVAISVQGFSIALIAFIFYAVALDVEGYELQHAQTLCYIMLTITQLIHSFMCHSLFQSVFVTGIKNMVLVGGVAVSTILMILACMVPGWNDIIELVQLDWLDWFKVLCSIVIHIIIVELTKVALRRWQAKTIAESALEEDEEEMVEIHF